MNNYNMDVVKEFKKLCTPSQFYLILSALSVVSVFLSTMNLGNLIVSLALATAWAYILNMVCNKVNNTVSWIIGYYFFETFCKRCCVISNDLKRVSYR